MSVTDRRTVWEITDKEYNDLMDRDEISAQVYRRCNICGQRVVGRLEDDSELQHVCWEHCPGHKWKSDYEIPYYCGVCGIDYEEYLQVVLEKHNIPYSKR